MDFASLSVTLPLLLVGMAGIFLVIGVLVLAVTVLDRLFRNRH